MRPLRLAALSALLAACGSTARIYVDHPDGIDGAWHLGEDEDAVALDATGEALTIRFRERRFRFPGIGSFRGTMSKNEVTLRGDIAIHLDAEVLAIDDRDVSIRRPLAEIPAGRTIVYTGGALLEE